MGRNVFTSTYNFDNDVNPLSPVNSPSLNPNYPRPPNSSGLPASIGPQLMGQSQEYGNMSPRGMKTTMNSRSQPIDPNQPPINNAPANPQKGSGYMTDSYDDLSSNDKINWQLSQIFGLNKGQA